MLTALSKLSFFLDFKPDILTHTHTTYSGFIDQKLEISKCLKCTPRLID